ncbi:MAG: MerR family DNA-binding transcriptional regulator [Gammaproteobacteria bacterium]|nr:MAG: MerR family DNA-binding transcriptional regulator [Gammaproteobacteria bacterium]
MASKTYTIRDLAREFDITTRTIRFYESEGLLAPRREGQTRIYSEKDRVNLKLVLRGKRLGLTLAESRELIEMYDPEHGNVAQLQRLLEKISERRVMLEQQLADIRLMQTELDAAEERCLNALQKARQKES